MRVGKRRKECEQEWWHGEGCHNGATHEVVVGLTHEAALAGWNGVRVWAVLTGQV